MIDTTVEEIKKMLVLEDVTFDSMIEIVIDLQKSYIPELKYSECEAALNSILSKREVQHTILTGLELDRLATDKLLQGPIQEIIESDFSLYGIDEVLALSITNIYGSIASSTFGYLDKTKPGIIGILDNKTNGKVHTFLDDIVCALIAAACSKLAHTHH